MPKYVTLYNWTDQGVKSAKDTVNRYQAACLRRRRDDGDHRADGLSSSRLDPHEAPACAGACRDDPNTEDPVTTHEGW